MAGEPVVAILVQGVSISAHFAVRKYLTEHLQLLNIIVYACAKHSVLHKNQTSLSMNIMNLKLHLEIAKSRLVK